MNAMCYDCKRLGNDCTGTRNQVWTGCVWKKKREYNSNLTNSIKNKCEKDEKRIY